MLPDPSNRQIIRKTTRQAQAKERDWVGTTAEERWAAMWQLAVDAWAMKGEDVADQRLQRHVVRVYRRKR